MFIEYKGEQLPVRVSSFAIKMLKKEKGIDLQEINPTNIEAIECLLYWGLVAGHKYLGQEMKYSKEDVQWILDDTFFEFLKVLNGDTKNEVNEGEKENEEQKKS